MFLFSGQSLQELTDEYIDGVRGSVCGSLIHKPQINEFLDKMFSNDPVVFDGCVQEPDKPIGNKGSEMDADNDTEVEWSDIQYELKDSKVIFKHDMMLCGVS